MAISQGLALGFQGASGAGCGLFTVIAAPAGDGAAGCNSDKSLLLWLVFLAADWGSQAITTVMLDRWPGNSRMHFFRYVWAALGFMDKSRTTEDVSLRG
jgi:hypothetical protein